MKYKIFTLALILILPFVLAAPAFAQEPLGDQVLLGQNLTLESGEVIGGDVVVFGGNVTLAEGSEVDGDMAVFGGYVEIAGAVNGDLGVVGGNLDLAETAVINGDIGMVGGVASVADGADVRGQIQSLNRFGLGSRDNFDLRIPTPGGSESSGPRAPEGPQPPIPPRVHVVSGSSWTGQIFNFIGHVVGNIVFLVALLGISWLVAAFMPDQMRVVGDAITTSAPVSFVVGLLSTVIAMIVGVLLVITICLAFIPILGWLLLGIAMLFGWIAAGQIIGERLLSATGRPYTNFVGSTLLGVTVITVISKMPIISQIPCLGFILAFVGGLLGFVVSMVGLGAVILTRFGTQTYVPGGSSSQPGPRPNPAPASSVDVAEKISALERAEAELKAKIKEALAEADALEEDETPTEEEPAPEDTPGDDTPEDGPEDGPKPAV